MTRGYSVTQPSEADNRGVYGDDDETFPGLVLGRKWNCMVCGAWRLADKIEVLQRLSRHQPPAFITWRTGPQLWNVTYCTDRPTCVAWALADGPWPGPPTGEQQLALQTALNG